jgi:hypothetical protein
MAVLVNQDRNMIVFERPALSAAQLEQKNEQYAAFGRNWRWSDDEQIVENLPRVFYYLADSRGRTIERDFISKRESAARQAAETRGKWRFTNSCPASANHHVYSTCGTCGQKD